MEGEVRVEGEASEGGLGVCEKGIDFGRFVGNGQVWSGD